MLPICMVTEETLAQVPEEVRLYLRALRRRIIELESTDPQQRIAELEAVNRGLQVELDAALALSKLLQKLEPVDVRQTFGDGRELREQRLLRTARRHTEQYLISFKKTIES